MTAKHDEDRLTLLDDIVRTPAYLRARNRWQLARMLMANPTLRLYRAHALVVHNLPPVNNPYGRLRARMRACLAKMDRGAQGKGQTRDCSEQICCRRTTCTASCTGMVRRSARRR